MFDFFCVFLAFLGLGETAGEATEPLRLSDPSASRSCEKASGSSRKADLKVYPFNSQVCRNSNSVDRMVPVATGPPHLLDGEDEDALHNDDLRGPHRPAHRPATVSGPQECPSGGFVLRTHWLDPRSGGADLPPPPPPHRPTAKNLDDMFHPAHPGPVGKGGAE